MALTTSDELHKQLTVIFGFTSTLNLEVGNIIGIGKLNEHKTQILISQTLQFLNAYNAILRDYMGCELYSIEFDLENLDKSKESLQILPKSMLFIPAEYKERQTLMLLLSPEMALLDHKKAKKSVRKLAELYFEVEEAVDRPELEKKHQKEVLARFANRFALKLQGEVLEGSWNRKLVGIRNQADEEPFEEYLSVRMNKKVNWDLNKQLTASSARFSFPKIPLSQEDEFSFTRYKILASSAFVLADHTFRLSSNLLNIANTGTIDDIQNELLILYLDQMINNQYTEEIPIEIFKKLMISEIQSIPQVIQEFHDNNEKFCRSGDQGDVESLIDACFDHYPNENVPQSQLLNRLVRISQKYLRHEFSHKKMRANEFLAPFVYLEENAKMILKALQKSFPQYYKYYLLMENSKKIIVNLIEEFSKQRKPVMALGYKYLEKFGEYLKNEILAQIIYQTQTDSPGHSRNWLDHLHSNEFILSEFKNLVKMTLETFIQDVNIEIEDLMGFVEIMMANIPEAQEHIENLKIFRKECEFLWGLILRNSSLHRFLKEYPEEAIFDPQQFSIYFIEFLRKRLGGLQIQWKDVILGWIQDYSQISQPKYLDAKDLKKPWSKQKVVDTFIQFFNDKVQNQLTLEGFKEPLRNYVNKFAMNINNRLIKEIYNSYEMSLELIEQVPDFIRQVFLKVIESVNYEVNSLNFKEYLGKVPDISLVFGKEINKAQLDLEMLSTPEKTYPDKKTKIENYIQKIFTPNSYYDFILNTNLKYFSKILAYPSKIYLKSLDQDIFQGKTLIHKVDFKFWSKFMKTSISTNYRYVKPQF